MPHELIDTGNVTERFSLTNSETVQCVYSSRTYDLTVVCSCTYTNSDCVHHQCNKVQGSLLVRRKVHPLNGSHQAKINFTVQEKYGLFHPQYNLTVRLVTLIAFQIMTVERASNKILRTCYAIVQNLNSSFRHD